MSETQDIDFDHEVYEIISCSLTKNPNVLEYFGIFISN